MRTLNEQMALVQSLNVIDDVFFHKIAEDHKFARRYCGLFWKSQS